MADMSMQDRYNDIVRLSGLSEEVVRRVLKASRQSLAASLKKGDRATLPGLCTMIPEERTKFDITNNKEVSFIKIKTKTSNALASEVERISSFENSDDKSDDKAAIKLNLDNAELGGKGSRNSGIRTTQINALL